MGKLDGKVAIVTGAGKGCGKYEAIALAKEGAAVTVCARTLSDVEEVAKEIEAFGGKALATTCDVGVRAECDAAVKATVDKFGTVDILVNNAHYLGWEMTPLEDWTEEDIRANYDTGAMGSWYFMVACFPYMKENGGKIINTTSMSAHNPHQGLQATGYVMAKGAIRALTYRAAEEWGKYKINVNCISPAVMTPAVKERYNTEEARLAVAQAFRIPLGYWSDEIEQHIGRPVVFLASSDSDYITGSVISCDGGMAMLV